MYDDFTCFSVLQIMYENYSLRKKCPYSELLWSTFSAFGLNTERYSVSLCIQSKCGKMRTRIPPNTDTFPVIIMMIPLMLRFPGLLTASLLPNVSPGVSACFFQCFYGFLRCFFCFPSLFPLFPILDFAVETDMRRTTYRKILLGECNAALSMLFFFFLL